MIATRVRHFVRTRTSRGFRIVGGFLLGLLLLQSLLTWSLVVNDWYPTGRLLGVVTGYGLLLLIIVMLAFAGVQLYRKRFQFGLRTLLLAMTVVSLLLALCGAELLNAHRERQAAGEIQDLGGMVNFRESDTGLRQILRWLADEDIFPSATNVIFDTDEGLHEGLKYIERLPSVRTIWVEGPQISDEGIAELSQLEDMPHVEHLILYDTWRVTDEGLATIGPLSHIRYVALINTPVTEAGLNQISTLERLERLSLHHPPSGLSVEFAEAGLKHLRELPKLQYLRLDGCPVTDDGLVHLHEMNNLRQVSLWRTSVTREGIEQLKDALPQCRVDPSWLEQ